MFFKRVKINKLQRFLAKKYLNSILKKFHSKLQLLKNKFEIKRKKRFLSLLSKFSNAKRFKSEKLKYHLINLMKNYKIYHNIILLKILIEKWRKISLILKQISDQRILEVSLLL